jgi:predicted nucleic-acid-binding Zn-ribbon protein
MTGDRSESRTMSRETRITANPLSTEIHAITNQPSKVETRICMKDGRCPKCSSTDVIPNVSILEHNGSVSENVKAVVAKNPKALFFRGKVKTSLKAWVCGSCGYTELYAKNPAALLDAYRKREK